MRRLREELEPERVRQPVGDGGAVDAFVTAFDLAGTGLRYSTYLGGGSDDYGNAVEVDAAGVAYVTGQTQSTNFPTKNALQPKKAGRDYDAFVTKVSAN